MSNEPDAFGATAKVRNQNAELELSVRIDQPPLNGKQTTIATITLRNVGDHPIYMSDFDPYLWLRDSKSQKVEMTDFGLGHFFNQNRVGSDFGATIPVDGQRQWTADLSQCFRTMPATKYWLEVEFDPDVRGPADQLSNFGLTKIPVVFR